MYVSNIFTPAMAYIPETLEHQPFIIDMFPSMEFDHSSIERAVGQIKNAPIELLTRLLWSKNMPSHSGVINGLRARSDLVSFGAMRVLDFAVKSTHTVHSINGQLIALCVQDDSCFHASTQLIYDARLIGFRSLQHVYALVSWNIPYLTKYLSDRRFSNMEMIWAKCYLPDELFTMMKEQAF
jgi:hypothetical protein